MKTKLIVLTKFLHRIITKFYNYLLYLEEKEKNNERNTSR